MIRVRSGGRLHFGFLNLSLAHERLYGGIGAAISSPEMVVTAETDDGLDCPHPDAARFAERVVDRLDLPGAAVRVDATLPRHVGLGSGTQLALSTYTAIARAYGRTVEPRAAAPWLDRGGRSGVGVATFEAGGFVVDGGHPTERFTTDRPPVGGWTVPPVTVRHALPPSWRFVVIVPDVEPGISGEQEDASVRSVVEAADPRIADEIAAILVRQLLPAVASADLEAFGRAVGEIGRLNGVWYADEQGGVYRPPVGVLVDELRRSRAISGVDQSSWGPAVYGITDAPREDEARDDAHEALAAAGVTGHVFVSPPRNEGAQIESV